MKNRAAFGGPMDYFSEKGIFFSGGPMDSFPEKGYFFSGPPPAALWYTIIEFRAVQNFERPNVGPPLIGPKRWSTALGTDEGV